MRKKWLKVALVPAVILHVALCFACADEAKVLGLALIVSLLATIAMYCGHELSE